MATNGNLKSGDNAGVFWLAWPFLGLGVLLACKWIGDGIAWLDRLPR